MDEKRRTPLTGHQSIIGLVHTNIPQESKKCTPFWHSQLESPKFPHNANSSTRDIREERIKDGLLTAELMRRISQNLIEELF